MASRLCDNLILKFCEIHEQPCFRLPLSSECHQATELSPLLHPALVTLHCLVLQSPCCRCSPLKKPNCWEQAPVSSSWTHVSEAALWENSETDLLDYAWRQVTCQVLHNENAIKTPFTSQVRPLLKLDYFFFCYVMSMRNTNVQAHCWMEEKVLHLKCTVTFFLI